MNRILAALPSGLCLPTSGCAHLSRQGVHCVKQLSGAVALGLLLLLSGMARAQPTTVTTTPRVFTGSISLSGDSINFSGALQANNPKCVLTVPSNSNGIDSGV